MSVSIGIIERASGDDYPCSVNFAAVDVFTTNHVTSATLSAVAVTGTAPTLGSATVGASDDTATFRVSGSNTPGDTIVTITATNTASPANVVVRTLVIRTL